jgi:ADP-ribose pyrophosphatase
VKTAQDRPLNDNDTDGSVEIRVGETLYQGYFRMDRYTLRHRTHAGGWSGWFTRELFERGHAVAVLPYDPARDTVVLVEQFRVGALAGGMPAWQLEPVAGIIEPGESPEMVARRETHEEAGLSLLELIPISRYLVSPGASSETVTLFCGLIDSAGAGGLHGLAEEGEDIRAHPMTFEGAFARLGDGAADNAPMVIALHWLALNRDRLRTRG